VRGEGGWLLAVFMVMNNLAREVEMLQDSNPLPLRRPLLRLSPPRLSSTSSYSSPPRSPPPPLLPTTSLAERRHSTSTCHPPSLRLANPQVDVRESLTQAQRRATTGYLCETKKKKNIYAMSLESELRRCRRPGGGRRPHLFIHVDHVYSATNAAGNGSVSPYFQPVGRYLFMHVIALQCSAALPSIAIHTFDCLTIGFCTFLITPLSPPSCLPA
jgi:hypothetical protein